MLNAAKPVCFVATAKPAAAKKFYRDKLELKLVEDGPFAIVFEASGTMLRVQKVQTVAAAPYTALGWEVNDIRTAVKQLQENGVRFELFDGMPQDDVGVWTSPSGAKVAWFKDPDGNILSLTQFRAAAKRPTTRRRKTSRRSLP